jgi:peptidoglycan/xylan/chitin deacetylase (PgdA/CDA1 family)
MLTAAALAATIVVGCNGWFRIAALSSVVIAQSIVTALGVIRPQWHFFGPGICLGTTSGRRVALTFDDGPDPAATPALLDLLSRRGIRATFFCIGKRASQHPEICRRAMVDGHQVENHSHEHSRVTNLFPIARLRQDLVAAQTILTEATGCPPRFFRPPMGLTNLRVFRVADELGLQVVGWTARGRDQRARTPEEAAARLLAGVRPGAILLLHDGDNEPARLLRIVELLVDKLEAQGYQCVRLDTLLEAR